MLVKVSNFGDILMSHPAGREAFLMAKAYVFNEVKPNDDTNNLQYINTENPSVKASLKTVLAE
jgi:hypothetical protein